MPRPQRGPNDTDPAILERRNRYFMRACDGHSQIHRRITELPWNPGRSFALMVRGGHHKYIKQPLATHLSRTAKVNNEFLLPHIKDKEHNLDLGRGPDIITTERSKYVSKERVIGLTCLQTSYPKARTLAAEANVPRKGPSSLSFEEGSVLDTLPYPDEFFNVVFCYHIFGHIPMPDQPLQAIAETRRVLKLGGIQATRDDMEQHFYPHICQV
ncbi:hypothetical protein BJY01DRAFT_254937 [Aspergillus pseudoustus]|uniref:Methyltransferase type 11 domain-containing protein n=1 Tax=Aspergillus pseudoustus TaxID=1810923 RepID=A0ABR4IPE3_9EURO